MATRGPDHQRLPAKYPATVEEIVTAQRQGEEAAVAGRHVSACPYRAEDGQAPTEVERAKFLQLMWARAYRHVQAERREAADRE